MSSLMVSCDLTLSIADLRCQKGLYPPVLSPSPGSFASQGEIGYDYADRAICVKKNIRDFLIFS